MIHLEHLRGYVIRPVLARLDLHGGHAARLRAAEQLLLGTAVQESVIAGEQYLRQHPQGPALGIYQMEARTHDDILGNYLAHRPELAAAVGSTVGEWPRPRAEALVGNLFYATAMARIHYYRVPAALPHPDDTQALGRYWKQHYNTPLGAGEVWQFARAFERYVAPLY